ncbi:MAG: hypothetical protein KA155_09250 [Alphaproteobacteria bacterium]|jgi:hypothetical protein|nr:hypothetical protein [Alphaproteobacteria bacterium]
MIFKRTCPLLSLMAVILACPVQAEELEPFNDYTPPPLLFGRQYMRNTPQEDKKSGFLTTIEPEQEEAKTAPAVKKPTPPAKPMSTVKKKALISKPKVPEKKAPIRPTGKATLAEGQLLKPDARDILASIEGVKPPQGDGKGKVSLSYLPGETSLTMNMKNILLTDCLPVIRKHKNSRIEIHAYAVPGGAGVVAAKRVSLARALETRDFLTAAGVNASRINIMPLGDIDENVGADRVDVVVARKAQ